VQGNAKQSNSLFFFGSPAEQQLKQNKIFQVIVFLFRMFMLFSKQITFINKKH